VTTAEIRAEIGTSSRVAGEKVTSLSKELGVSEATLYLWKRQALIDAGRAEGVKNFEADELAQAHRTIAELEAEPEAVKAARLRRSGSLNAH